VLVETVLDLLAAQPGEKVLDLYAGVGLFAAFLADRVGPDRVVAVEGHPVAARDAVTNLPSGVRVLRGDVATVLRGALDEPFDLVVLDPPREGARRAVVEQVAQRAPRAVAYVACDPAALARDVASFAEQGYALTALRAFDVFPMTHHVECVALLEKARPPGGLTTGAAT
jgi:tRNA/tmRNA/rRNA uracil-C5-methylase (TrmA/RlmC/RlmD family)